MKRELQNFLARSIVGADLPTILCANVESDRRPVSRSTNVERCSFASNK